MVIYEDDIVNLGDNLRVSGSMLDNSYSSSKTVENLQQKVDDILKTDYQNENALRMAWHNAGAWDINQAQRLADDLRAGIIRDIRNNPDVLNRVKKYNSLSRAEKQKLWEDINYIVGGQNRVHSGRTIIGFMDDSDFVAAGKRGFGGAHNGLDGDDVHMFRYLNGRMDNFEDGIGVVVHENTHGFQNLGRTAITEQGLPYKSVNYRGDGSKQYSNQLIEVEARFVQEKVKEGFLRELLR